MVCVLYARLSVAADESVSIARQVRAAEAYADARGWSVVGTFIDDGVSASLHRPEDRPGWRALLSSPEPFDAVVIWKVDRLARRVIDFLNADAALRERNAAIVAVEDPVDMTTPTGRLLTTMLAAFAELEAAAISARVTAANAHLRSQGRARGGAAPYGWRTVRRTDGPGYVVEQDPDRVDYVREAASRVARGDSVYAVKGWLDEIGAPLPTGRARQWSYTTVERLLRNPILAGMVVSNPGNRGRERGPEVLRDSDGLPVVVEGLGIMAPAQWRALVAALDERSTPQSRPRAMRSSTSALLSGLLWCADCDVRMWRGTVQGRHGFYCPSCSQVITNFEHVVVEHFLWAKGEHVRWTVLREVHEGGSARLPEIAVRISELGAELAGASGERVDAILAELGRLKALEAEVRSLPMETRLVSEGEPQFFDAAWAAAQSVEDRRAVLDDALERIDVRRGRPGRATDASKLERLEFRWKVPSEVGPLEHSDMER